jgi:hypothetical protein
MVTCFRPGIWEKNVRSVEALGWQHALQYLNRIMLNDAQIAQTRLTDLLQQTPNAGRVNINSKVIILQMHLGDRNSRLSHTKTDLKKLG